MEHMSKNPGESVPEEVPKAKRDMTSKLDILNTQINGQLTEGNPDAELDVEDCVRAAEDMLDLLEAENAEGRKPYKDDVDAILKKLNTAIAISNETYARELRKRLLMRFG